MRLPSSLAICVLAATLFACSSPNPDFCCVTGETCAAAGLAPDDLRPCDVGQACRSYECVAAECVTSADCTSADAPACIQGLCVAGCAIDDDCAGVAGRPRCDATDATCVGCTSSDQCPADRAICDAEARACRGCTADDECASGVCIEATGRCAADDEILYVSHTGTDAGTCPKSSPCNTLSFAMGLTTQTRSVIRILGGMYYLGTNPLYLASRVTIDGSNTALVFDASPAVVASAAGVLEGVRLKSGSGDAFTPLIRISSGSSLALARMMVEDGQIEVVAGGTLEVTDARMENVQVNCRTGGSLTLRRSHFEQSYIDSACELVLSESYLQPAPAFLPFRFQGSSQRIENNVFAGNDAEMHMILVGPSASTFRFNTVSNSSAVVGSGIAVTFDETVNMTSNIIAYSSTQPILGTARHSLFDTAGALEASRGVGNRSSDVSTIFRDRQAGDFRLTAASPAIGWGEPGLVTSDFDGKPRPIPAGSMPDVGAFEAP